MTWYVCYVVVSTWWRHQMETFTALLAISAGNTPVPGEFPAQRSVARSFDVFFDLRLNKRLSKQSWGWWFETLSHPLWRYSNVWHHSDVACVVVSNHRPDRLLRARTKATPKVRTTGRLWGESISSNGRRVFISWRPVNNGNLSPDSNVHGANMGPIWGRQNPVGPHVGPMNFAIWEIVL